MMRQLLSVAAVFLLLLATIPTPPLHANIGGWTLGSTTLTGGDITLASTGNITAGTGNNVVRISDTGTNRLWVGHATATSAPFRVTQGGAVTASDLTVTGGSITGTTATFASVVTLNASGITVTPSASGFDDARSYKFATGVGLYGVSTNAFLRGTTVGLQATGSRNLSLGAGGLLDENANIDVNIGGTIVFGNLAGSGNDYVCVDASGQLFRSNTAC